MLHNLCKHDNVYLSTTISSLSPHIPEFSNFIFSKTKLRMKKIYFVPIFVQRITSRSVVPYVCLGFRPAFLESFINYNCLYIFLELWQYSQEGDN